MPQNNTTNERGASSLSSGLLTVEHARHRIALNRQFILNSPAVFLEAASLSSTTPLRIPTSACYNLWHYMTLNTPVCVALALLGIISQYCGSTFMTEHFENNVCLPGARKSKRRHETRGDKILCEGCRRVRVRCQKETRRDDDRNTVVPATITAWPKIISLQPERKKTRAASLAARKPSFTKTPFCILSILRNASALRASEIPALSSSTFTHAVQVMTDGTRHNSIFRMRTTATRPNVLSVVGDK